MLLNISSIRMGERWHEPLAFALPFSRSAHLPLCSPSVYSFAHLPGAANPRTLIRKAQIAEDLGLANFDEVASEMKASGALSGSRSSSGREGTYITCVNAGVGGGERTSCRRETRHDCC